MNGLEAICPNCGDHFYGWALCNSSHQYCLRCGCGLEIRLDGEHIATGYSPFSAEEYKIRTIYSTEMTNTTRGENDLPFRAGRT
jgi:hypothetical protein